jgi:hypothetical protein
MTRQTRYFVIASLLVLCAGVGTGLVAYYGLPTRAFGASGGSAELRYLPSTATLAAYADVHEVMTSELRQKLRAILPTQADGQRSFLDATGINIETDVDRVALALTPSRDADGPSDALLITRGRFDAVRLEGLLRERGAQVETVSGKRLITLNNAHPPQTDPSQSPQFRTAHDALAVTFLEPGLAAIGSPTLVRRAIDQKETDSLLASDDIMSRVRALDDGNVWAVGRFDALTARAGLTKGMVGQLPSILWFSASGQVDSGIKATLKAETRDDEAANGLRDVIRGFVALAKMQTRSRPELQQLIESVQLGGTGRMVDLKLELSPQTLDLLTKTLRQPAVAPPAP